MFEYFFLFPSTSKKCVQILYHSFVMIVYVIIIYFTLNLPLRVPVAVHQYSFMWGVEWNESVYVVEQYKKCLLFVEETISE